MNKKRKGVDQSLLTDKWEDIINDDEIEIMIEVMGGIEPARTMILEALHAGKNVVTANKDLVATHGHELLEAAEESGVDFLFEAAVAGAIPIIRPLKQCLAANEIQEVIGIVNGTTNFILTKMIEEGMDLAMHWHLLPSLAMLRQTRQPISKDWMPDESSDHGIDRIPFQSDI